jgi:IS30 family transposase
VTRELDVNRLSPSRPRAVPLGERAGSRGPVRSTPNYSPSIAQQRFEARLARPKTAKLAQHDRLRAEVAAKLSQNHSPEQISHRLVADFPDDPEMRVSHETIYQSLYVQGRGALKRELARHLRTGRSLRKPQRKSGQRLGRIKDMVSISDRPAEVEDRAVPGHWEGDLIIGEGSRSAIGTLVERKTGFVLLLHLPDDHGALAVQRAMIVKMSELPQLLRRTLTWDQGIEMANHVQIAAATDLDIYFCDPHSPWQRGSNENTNGLLRQYFPKGTDLSRWGPGYLDYVAAELNNRPRKRHTWKTPADTLDQLLSKSTEPPTVAMTG